jgi:hypothetical protein
MVTAFSRTRWNGHLTPREACLRDTAAVKSRTHGQPVA